MLMVSKAKQDVEGSEDIAPMRLPPPERETPRLRQVGELGVLQLSGENECAHSLVDKAEQMLEDDVIRYLGADECRKQEQEMQGVKKDRELRTDARGFVREMLVLADVVADTTSVLKLKNAFVRRGLALDQAQVMSCSLHEKLVAFFLHRKLTRRPVGFARFPRTR
jgi:hypothetical protein